MTKNKILCYGIENCDNEYSLLLSLLSPAVGYLFIGRFHLTLGLIKIIMAVSLSDMF